ncbi:hypothetical protein HMPREF9628_00297 [Peptoanaerobacter stomatis]|uniref:Uncharacterized protein n=1 Tax=Peptoanaerobacter stomatis TaxID=796937 RepID=G9XD58_9FIRM|nr:hypothetical protein HMPREF9628_00297 [Peptoanaerobacter stomatis]
MCFIEYPSIPDLGNDDFDIFDILDILIMR